MRVLSDVTTTECTRSSCPVRGFWTASPVSGSQIRTVPSRLPETTRELSGVNTADETGPVCPIMVRPAGFPELRFQTVTRWSLPPVTMRVPSDDTATEWISPSV
jgi:hypothetical protein